MELQSKETTGRETLVEMDTRLQTVEKNQLEMLELMRILASQAMRGASPEPDIGINLELIVDSPEEEEDEEVKSGGLAPLPLRKRLRTNTICGRCLSVWFLQRFQAPTDKRERIQTKVD